MGCNTGSATIEFPARFLDDEIRDCLVEHENVGIVRDLELKGLGDTEVEISGGIFRLHDSEVCYGFFEELEDLLVKKGVPFDRYSAMDWSIIPCNRVFRPGWQPGQPAFRLSGPDFPATLGGNPDVENFNREFILNPDTDEPCVSLADIRELLTIDDAGEEAAAAIRRYIDDKFPVYPELSEYVGASHES
jgi:hypothetical protein